MIILFEIDGDPAKIDLPISLDEIQFSDFCDFKAMENEYWQINKESDADSTEPVNKLVDALRCIVKGDIDMLPFSYRDDNYQELIDRKYQVSLKDEISLLRVYAHLVVLIQDYKPESIPDEFKINWNGSKYRVKSGPAARILANKPLTTGEAIEALEYQRRSVKAAENAPGESGNIEFTLGLTELALLVRKQGEKLPSNRKDLDRFIKDRQRVFQNIPLDKVVDLRFFFLNALVKLSKTPTTSSFGMGRREGNDSQKQRKKGSVKNWLKMPGK